MAKSYIAKYQGKVVGKRTTKDRIYTHAIVIIASREYYRKAAYDYRATETDKSNYRYHCAIAEGRSPFGHTAEDRIESSGKIDGGFDAYIAKVRQRAIESFERRVTAGDFEPFVVAWAGRSDLALKAAAQHRQIWNDVVEIVPAEEVIKPKPLGSASFDPTAAQRERTRRSNEGY